MRPLLLVLFACSGPDSSPDSTTDDPVDSSDVEPTGDTATDDTDTPFTPTITGSATVRTQVELAPWLGFTVELDGVSEATLACDSTTDPTETHARTVSAGESSLPGLLGGHTYTCRLVGIEQGPAGPVEVELWTEEATTPDLPDGLPALTHTSSPGAELTDGWVIFNQWDDGPIHRVIIVDGQGRIRWHRGIEAASGGTHAEWAPPHVVAGGGQNMPPTLFDLDGNEVYRAPQVDDPEFFHHEAREVVHDGVAGVLGVVATGLPNGNPDFNQQGFRIDVFDPSNDAVIWSYDVVDHIADWSPVDYESDPWHVNAVTWEEDGHSWVSARGTNEVKRVNRATGEITHTLGKEGDVTLLDADGVTELDRNEWFTGQHGPNQVGDRFFLFDNGYLNRAETIAVEYVLDLDAHTATRVWEWTEPGWVEPYYGNVDLLPGGHVLVGSGHCNRCDGTGGADRNAFIAEIDQATNDVLWRLQLDFPKASIFRAHHIPACEIFHHTGLCSQE